MRRRLALATTVALAAIAGCRPAESEPPRVATAPAPAPAPSDHDTLPSDGGVEGSLYDLRLEHLTDARGNAIALDAHRGHPVVVSMFYATCKSACPALMLELHDVDARLDPEAREAVRYLLVSFDPGHDDTAALAKVVADHGLDARWTLARTDEREVRLLATALGLRYRFREDGQIDHSTNVALVRPDGALDVRIDGLGQPKEELIRRIGELAE